MQQIEKKTQLISYLVRDRKKIWVFSEITKVFIFYSANSDIKPSPQ